MLKKYNKDTLQTAITLERMVRWSRIKSLWNRLDECYLLVTDCNIGFGANFQKTISLSKLIFQIMPYIFVFGYKDRCVLNFYLSSLAGMG